jgi:hypothetical protein
MKKLIVIYVLAAALASRALAQGTFSDNFSTGLNPAYWSIYESVSNVYSVNATGTNVVLAKSGTTTGNQVLNVVLNLAALGGNISGDFSEQINFSNAVIGPALDQVQLDDSFADGGQFYDVYDLSSGRNVHVFNGSSVENPITETATSGTFAISRTGSTLTGYYNGTAIYSESESAALSYIDFRLETQGSPNNDSPSVAFGDFSLTASSVPEPETLSLLALGGMAFSIRFWRFRKSVRRLNRSTTYYWFGP